MSIIAIMQPTYLPWLGYFDLIDCVDKFVFLDDVNVLKRSWGVRNRIKTVQGEVYLTVPLLSRMSRDKRLFTNTAIDYCQNWNRKHLKSLTHAYSKSPFFNEIHKSIEKLLTAEHPSIGDLNISIIQWISSKMGIPAEFYRSSDLNNIRGRKDDRLVNICRAFDADQYLSPQGSADYIESEHPGGAITEAGIELYYHNFEHPEYPQLWTPFLSHMCIVDLLMNCGYSQSLDIIRSGRRKMIPCMTFRKMRDSQHVR